ncbi:MAG: ABC-F family ATP-binding cassette domain-containing protein [SAR324 cluster bacterium]|nr:ABC-F family ATP-binding cassette domain-containing protein [SAR324 cluster bacterium]
MPASLLVSAQSISKSFGVHSLFSDISLSFFEEERLGLIGPNGAGKSTLLKIMAGLETPDSGSVSLKRGTHLVYLAQKDQLDPEKTVEQTLLDSMPAELGDAEHFSRIREVTRLMAFEKLDQKVGTLSGGWRKRLSIVRALIQKPDILLMDEPTNHLDLQGILQLESLLKQAPFAFVLVSHDRYFLENTTNRTVELNRQFPGGFLKIDGNYSEFLQNKEDFLAGQLQQESVLANKVRREIEWLRRGPKARSTKAQYRIDSAYQLQNELGEVKARNAQNKSAQIDFEATHRKTRLLVEATDLKIARSEKTLCEHLNLQLSPGKCLGILGQNGSGKSSLIHTLTGDLKPEQGTIIRADGIRMVIFDQKREQLNYNQTLRQALSPAGDSVVFRDRSIHVASWAKRFLFSSDQLGMPVADLSGGEQARILIANLMLKPADVLLLDEPTNDLDIPTLEVLEESLGEFPGALVLITHDRFLIDRLSDQLLYLDGNGHAEYFADYDQWLQSWNQQQSLQKNAGKEPQKKQPKKLTFEEQKELGRIDKKIEKAEEAVAVIQQKMHESEITSNVRKLSELYAQLQEAEDKVAQLYQRWEELEALSQ